MTDDNTPDSAPADNNGRRGPLLLIISTVIVVAAIAWTLYWLFVLSWRENTDDGYVAGDTISVTTLAAGTVVGVLADDTQRVEVGQPLVRLDPTDTQVALSRAAAGLALAVRQVRQADKTATQFDAQIRARTADLATAEQDVARRAPLVASHAVAGEELKHAEAAVAVARAALEAARQQAAAAHAVVQGSDVAHEPSVLEARAAYEQAWIEAQRATVSAPISGVVAQRTVQVGQRIAPGQPLMSIVPLGAVWISANFKESQLRNLRLGQPAEVTSDTYGGKVVFHGHVSGLSAGTGSAFSLLPAQNASGNWIKVTQRLPVRIDLDPAELRAHPLRIGLSSDVTVDTHDRSGSMVPTSAQNKPVGVTDIYADLAAEAARRADALIADAAARR